MNFGLDSLYSFFFYLSAVRLLYSVPEHIYLLTENGKRSFCGYAKKILQLERNNCPVGAENKGNNVSLHLKLRGKVAPCQNVQASLMILCSVSATLVLTQHRRYIYENNGRVFIYFEDFLSVSSGEVRHYSHGYFRICRTGRANRRQ